MQPYIHLTTPVNALKSRDLMHRYMDTGGQSRNAALENLGFSLL